MTYNPLLLTDFYKIGHPFQYPKGTTMVYSNLTARKSRIKGIDHIVFFGLQYFIKEYLITQFNEGFFNRPKKEVMEEYERVIKNTIGPLPSYEHIAKLHDLGYLPIEIKALPEGSKVPIRTACLTIFNTNPNFAWLTNFLESLMSAIIWMPITSATIAYEYKKLFTKYLSETIGDTSFVQWMGHDFSFRGMSGLEAAVTSGMGHLLSFTGTDTIPAILAAEKYYNSDITKELIGASVPATEHSVMCAGTGVEGEFETFKRLITQTYPDGIVSIVSDTFDLWKVLTGYMPTLKDLIMARDGKVVIRPDSGKPEDIICGTIRWDNKEEWEEEHLTCKANPVEKGVIELLWDTFGGTIVNGYKVLDPHVGAIYGDSITPDRAREISERLISKGFAPLLVYGIGSYTYQFNTRDTFGMAVKATYIKIAQKKEDGFQRTVKSNEGLAFHFEYEMEEKGIEIFKDPVTDDGTKKSAKGLLRIEKVSLPDGTSSYEMFDQQSEAEEKTGELQTVFKNGVLTKDFTFAEIRKNLS